MSRSYRKHPWITTKSKFSRKQAARRCRKKYVLLKDGCYYKKTYPQWDVRDYWWICSFRNYLDDCHLASTDKSKFKTEERSTRVLTYEPYSSGRIPVVRWEYYEFTTGKTPLFPRRIWYKKKLEVKRKTSQYAPEITYKTSSEEDKKFYRKKWKKEILTK